MPAIASHQLATVFAQHRAQVVQYQDEIASLKGLLDLCPLPMFLTGQALNMIYVNQAYLDLIDGQQPDVVGQGWLNFLDADDRELLIERWQQISAGSEQKLECPVKYLKMDGGTVNAKIRICRIFGGNYSGFIVEPAAAPRSS